MKCMEKLAVGIALLLSAVAAAAHDDTPSDAKTNVVLREYQQTMTLAPGERGSVSSVCKDHETVVGGGPGAVPGSLTIVFSTLLFDGVHSGWQVEYINNGTTTVTETPSTAALCVRGTMTLG